MRSMSDEELDKLFKEASEGVDFPADSEGWKAMSARLDQRPVEAAFWSKTRISMTAATGILLVALVWYFNSDSEKTELASNSLPTENSQPTENSSVNPQEIETLAKGDDAVGAKSESVNESILIAKKQSTNQSTNVVSKEPAYLVHDKTKMSSQGRVNNLEKSNVMQGGGISFTESKNNESVLGLESDNLKSSSQPNSDSKPQEEVTDSKEIVREESVIKDSLVMIESVEPQKEETKVPTPKIFSIKLAVAPDFSTIKFSSFESPGFNYGVMLGYNINSRLSVFAGVLSSRKIYSSTEGGNYSAGYYDYPVKRIDGDCRILDIPVNFYYGFNSKQLFSIKVGLGISSYLMLDEAYVYQVDKQYGSDTYKQHVSNKNHEWFKVANLSVIVEKQLSNRMFLELEPFVKAPLAGVGEGKVSLVSLGAFLNLRYDISLK
jgi:hypothetical protein